MLTDAAMDDYERERRAMSRIRWQRVNDDGFEYAIQQGVHGDEFVKLPDGSCLRRSSSARREASLRERGLGAFWKI